VILDVEGATVARPLSPRLGWMLSLASAAVAAAALLAIAARPHDSAPRFVESGPSVLEQAFAKPAQPRLALLLPAELAVPLAPVGSQYGSGIGRATIAPRSYRLRASTDVVTVAPVPDGIPITPPANRPADALAVHGSYAQSWMVEPTSLTVLRWTENGTTYEISSRTLPARELARIAEQLR
jgi:hypothetical protein